MPDRFTQDERSLIMSRVKASNTTPELVVRKLLHHMGYRYRLNVRKLPGNPDIVLHRHKKIVLVHGCFWHGHDCKRGRRPATNVEFWNKKLDSNIQRDEVVRAELASSGWHVLVVWQCELRDRSELEAKLSAFMSNIGGNEDWAQEIE